MKHLVIVESPTKARTISQFLGGDFLVVSCFGHVRDLPQKELGVDVKDDFKPSYVMGPKERKIVSGIKTALAQARDLYLATDYDREGEAIAWHLIEALGLNELKTPARIATQSVAGGQNSKLKTNRITFHEITKQAIKSALEHPREIDMNLVNAQQARRILDRLVGYKLSPFLWKKVTRGLSAGRVQSVAVRLVVEREREIVKFKAKEFWAIEGIFKPENKDQFKAKLEKINGEPIAEIPDRKTAENYQKILNPLRQPAAGGLQYKISGVEKVEKFKSPTPPFMTSTLQQAASRRLSFSAKQTMSLAQRLYEQGYITYMRTDSFQISSSAVKQARQMIEKEFGRAYLPQTPRVYKTRVKAAQEAHEAIRPTDFSKRPEDLGGLEKNQVDLYRLIWERAIACQMADARVLQTTVEVQTQKDNKKYVFVSRGEVIKFPGFIKVYQEENDEKEVEQASTLPELQPDESVNLLDLQAKQNFTQPPNRYSEATLIRELEKRGIGRPSTYAPTISTIQDRGYVEKLQGKLHPQDIGMVVSDLLAENFPQIVDYDFTAGMEKELDDVAQGELEWQKMLKAFWEPFAKNLKEKMSEVSKKEVTEEKTDEKCPECSKPLVIKLGRFGKFYACSGFPDCKYTKPYLDNQFSKDQEEKIDKEIEESSCPKCGGKMILKDGRFGPFMACQNYPKCKGTKAIQLGIGLKCPECHSEIVQKTTRRGKIFWGCSGYPKCKVAYWQKPTEDSIKKQGDILDNAS